MTDVKQIAIERAIAMLRAGGAKFAIIDASGTKHGDLEIAPEKPLRRIIANPGITEYVRGFVGPLDVGASIVIPSDKYPPESVQSSAATVAGKQWGTGSVITHINDIGVEVLRIE